MDSTRTVIAKMEQYLKESDNMKEEIEELELLLGPEDSEVDLRERCTTSGVGAVSARSQEVDIRHIAMNARVKKRHRLFHFVSGQALP